MIKIIIVDDQRLMRDGLEVILSSYNDIEVAACGENGQQAVELAKEHNPQLILMDVYMPIMDGIAAAREIKKLLPHIKILFLTTFDDEKLIADGLTIGASGYIFKDMEKSKLVEAIKDCINGNIVIPPKVALALAHYASNTERNNSSNGNIPLISNLTDRELEVAVMVSEGFSNRQIASALYISDGTVKNYVSSIYSKTGIKDRIKLALFLKEKEIK